VSTAQSRFEADPGRLVDVARALPAGWSVETPDAGDPTEVERLTELLREHQQAGRGWASADRDEVLLQLRGPTRQSLVLRDPDRRIRAWAFAHDRAGGRMLLGHVVERGLDGPLARRCSDVLVEWAVGQARAVGAARGLSVQQVDSGAYAGDERQQEWLAGSGFVRVRTWWQMSRPVTPDEAGLVPDPARWENHGVVVRLVARGPGGEPVEEDLRTVHDVLEAAFTDHFNSKPETFAEFLHRLREDPGHRWDHWWLAEGTDEAVGPLGAVVASAAGSASYVDYIGVLVAARGRGVAKGLLRTVIADAAARGRDRVDLEVDADSPTGAAGLYRSLGWETAYVTESWHRDVPVTGSR